MIFTLLYSSSLLKENEYRNIYLYALGMVMYAVIHWLIFSSIGDKYELVQKYRYVLYAIAAGDMLFVSNKYKEFSEKINISKHQKHHFSNIEEVRDPPELQATNNPSQQIQQSSECNKQICAAPPKDQTCTVPKEQKDTTSVASLPVYVSQQHVLTQVTNNVRECSPDVELPVYTSHQHPLACEGMSIRSNECSSRQQNVNDVNMKVQNAGNDTKKTEED